MIEAGYLDYIDLVSKYKAWDGKPKGYSEEIEELAYNEE